MRNLIIRAGLLLLAATSPGLAQNIKFGVKAGLNTSTCSPIYSTPSAANRWGLVVGGFLRYPLGARVSLQPEMAYEQRGVRTVQDGTLGFEGSGGSYTRWERSRFQYLSLPLLVRGQLGKFFGLAGPQLSYLLTARQQATTQYVLWPNNPYPLPYPETETASGTSDFHRWELGYAAGVGYQVSGRLAFEVRYAASLTRLQQPREADVNFFVPISPLIAARNKSWQAQLSYQLSTLQR